MEFNQENFDKLQESVGKLTESVEKLTEENGNKEKAFQEERTKRKDLTKELDEVKGGTNEELETFKKEKKLNEEKKLKEKGKYDEIITEKDKTIEELTTKVESIEGKATKYDESLAKQLESKLESIPEDKTEFVTKVIDGKSHEEQVELLDGFIEEYNPEKKDFKTTPKKDGGKPIDTDTDEYQKAEKEGNVMGMIQNAPKVQEPEN